MQGWLPPPRRWRHGMTDRSSVYYYRSVNAQGAIETGQVNANSSAAAARALAQSGQRPLRVQARPIGTNLLNREISFGREKVITLRDAQSLSRDLAILTGSGLEVHRAIGLVAAALPPKSPLLGFVQAIEQGLSLGRGLAGSVRQSGYRAPDDFVAIIEAAERSGGLTLAFEMMASSYGRRLELHQKLVGAAIYPAFLVVVAFAALTIIAVFVAPSLAALFASLDRPLPLIMRVLTLVPEFLERHAVILGLIVLVLCVAGFALGQLDQVKEWVKTCSFRLPLIGAMRAWAATSNFAGLLHMSVLNNVPIATAVASAWEGAGFPYAKRDAALMADAMRRGKRLSEAADRIVYLPASARRLLAAGETSNRLADVLLAIAEEADRQVAYRATMLTNLMAPTLIVVVGSLIGTVVFSVFSALLEISQLTY